MSGKEEPVDACPVDEKTRQAWLKSNPTASWPGQKAAPLASSKNSCDSEAIDQTPPKTPANSEPQPGFLNRLFSSGNAPAAAPKERNVEGVHLGTQRVISTIPRATPVDGETDKPANSEKEGGVSANGKWIYPSEKMFFEAMKRKGHDSDPENMKTIVPIHNAVNERAWKEIKEWEKPYGAEKECGGPRLHSFLGLSTSLSPKARMNMLLGYSRPFDRHDWVVDRCGKKIEYIIDFYAGKDTGDGRLNFFLDVRPKLNTLEGWKMRAAKIVGLA
jgi:cytochrome c heme-lyase